MNQRKPKFARAGGSIGVYCIGGLMTKEQQHGLACRHEVLQRTGLRFVVRRFEVKHLVNAVTHHDDRNELFGTVAGAIQPECQTGKGDGIPVEVGNAAFAGAKAHGMQRGHELAARVRRRKLLGKKAGIKWNALQLRNALQHPVEVLRGHARMRATGLDAIIAIRGVFGGRRRCCSKRSLHDPSQDAPSPQGTATGETLDQGGRFA